MAIYHCSIKVFSRGKGDACAVDKAAYRSGEKIYNDRNGQTYDYTRKKGVVQTDIFLPANAPPEYFDRTVLWNAVEKSEHNDNAQLAREFEISLPVELTIEQNIALAHEFVKNTFVSVGMCADVCVHDKNDGNPHFHVMLTLRPFNADGTWAAKSRKEYILDDNGERIRLPSGEYKSRKVNLVDWNEQYKSEEWREARAAYCNAALERHGFSERIDHRSFERQGIEKIPSIHMGAAACQMEKKGIRTERGNINRVIAEANREIDVSNKQMGQLKARIRKSKEWVYAQPLEDAPSMITIMQNIGDGKNLQYRAQRIKNLQTRAKVLIFLQHNNIADLPSLVGKVEQINNEYFEVSKKIKDGDRRVKTLETHIAQYANYQQHKGIHKKYKSLDPKKRDTFYEKQHEDEIQLFEDAKKYLDGVMNGRTEVPFKKWEKEHAELSSERFALAEKFYGLQDDVRNVELLKKGLMNIMREDTQEREPLKTNNVEI